jgi:hypothetical protein
LIVGPIGIPAFCISGYDGWRLMSMICQGQTIDNSLPY